MFRLMFEITPSIQDRVGGVSPEVLANVTAEDIMLEADTNHDNVIDFEEFKQWMTSGSGLAMAQLETTVEDQFDLNEVASGVYHIISKDHEGNLSRMKIVILD